MKTLKIYDSTLDTNGLSWKWFCSRFKRSQLVNNECIVTGTLGLWNGRHNIIPCVCNDVLSAIQQCSNGNEFIIDQYEKHIEIYSYHHDGVNHYKIHLLNSRGLKLHHKGSYADLTKSCYHRVLKINKLFL